MNAPLQSREILGIALAARVPDHALMDLRRPDEPPPKAIVPRPPFKWLAYVIAGGIGAISIGFGDVAQSLHQTLIVVTMLASGLLGVLVVAAIIRGE